MATVASYDWESDSWNHNGDNPARTAWRDAVAEIAEKAKATLPECNGRVDSAVKIVLAGDVELLEGGKAKVASQSNGTTLSPASPPPDGSSGVSCATISCLRSAPRTSRASPGARSRRL